VNQLNRVFPISIVIVAVMLALGAGTAAGPEDPNLQPFPDPSGAVQTFSTFGFIDTQNPFFQSLGTNGRSCATCHQPGDAWSVTPAHIRDRFNATNGTDPIFRTNDGSNSPDADVRTVAARRSAYSMLLSKGLIRVGLPIPPNAEFSLEAVDDPYHYADAKELSLFRRPLPTTNLRFLSGVMWDGRQSPRGRSFNDNFRSQSVDATLGHAQAASDPAPDQQQQIVDFELSLHTAQVIDQVAGALHGDGPGGGTGILPEQEFFLGINDPLGLNPTGAPFDPAAFTLFYPWQNALARFDASARSRRPNLGAERLICARRESIARGERLFNTREIDITGVSGLNDELGLTHIRGFCTTCHDSPNVGNHSVAAPLNIGIADASRRTPDMPLYTLRNNATGETVQTTDPGRALITGKWKEIGRFKGPILRGLAARAPYFHNGMAATLGDAVNFYDARFDLRLTPQEKGDLVAFLSAL
jgi:cytochrome c peroxidase